MDGLLVYADIFSGWIENLSVFWSFLNSNVVSFIDSSINAIFGNDGSELALALFNAVKMLMFAFGFEDLTVLGVILSCMGFGFGVYFLIIIVRWVLDILP